MLKRLFFILFFVLFASPAFAQFSTIEVQILKSLSDRSCADTEGPVWNGTTLSWDCSAGSSGAIVSSASDPTVNDDSGDGYVVGTIWINTTDDTMFVAVDVTLGAAVWRKIIDESGTFVLAGSYDFSTATVTGIVAAESDTFESVTGRGRAMTTANSKANCVQIGDGVNPACIYSDALTGARYDTVSAADKRVYIPTDHDGGFFSEEDDEYVEKIDPDAATPIQVWTYPITAIRPIKSVYWDAGAISVDGTNCAAPTEQALNSAEKTWAFSCLDSNSSIFSGKIRMPPNYNGGTITFTLSLFHGTTETITFAGDFSAQCRAAGTAINSTYGTGVAADVAITTANQIAEATTAVVTPNGTCTTAGVWILWRYVVDAANFSANAANSKVLGVTMRYTETSRSH